MEEVIMQYKMEQLKCCVIIPTYNNHKTLERVISGVLEYTKNIIIVNDGSTDTTAQILHKYSQLEQVLIQENKGKGNALRVGFKHAISLDYDYAITIDSDGQHFPEDIPVFIKALEASENKNLLLIGARNMDQESVPKKSSFGNKFSNFWFWVETGVKLKDTQSGYRLYPLSTLKELRFFTTKFEFEIEVIVKAAWKDVIVKNIPVKVLYDETERVSHFRPFKDFTRISILNTWLVILTFLYIKPRNLFRRFKKKGVTRFLKEDVLRNEDSPRKKAMSIALGLFIGLSPLWGLHTLLAIFLAAVFKLNKTISFVFSNISLPPFIPFIVYISIQTGSFILNETPPSFSNISLDFETLKHLKTYIIGSFAFAAISAGIIGFISYIILFISSKKETPLQNG
jgi:glycosyltransferase involved in cell wall biosynthesis